MKKVIVIKEHIFQQRLVNLIVNGMHSNFFKRPGVAQGNMVATKRGERLTDKHLEEIQRDLPIKFGGICRFA